MAEIVYKESAYKFTDPVRYFKGNDPVYYKVLDIPLKQLMENDKWLKDQLGAQTVKLNEIDRSGFSELKPYVLGIDSTVRVKPGRYIARINHAYKLDSLQFLYIYNAISQVNDSTGQTMMWQAKSITDPLVSSILQKFKSTLEADSLGLNGMLGRSFAYMSLDRRKAGDFVTSTSGTYDAALPSAKAAYPITEVRLWANTAWASPNSNVKEFRLYQNSGNLQIGFATLQTNEEEFIKKWRSAVRTAVVDIPSDITIDIPPFDANDHYYISETGQKVLLDATQRIDLVFIYSKPIDSVSSTIAKFSNDTPTTITTPQLGIVRGAGIGMDFTSNPNPNNVLWPIKKGVDADGNPMMLSQVADENNTLLGFTGSGIHGSFPAPDDLMNLTPQLIETLESDNYMLVGQSVLPIAYVVVRKNGGINQAGQSVILDSDLIDIRPFFRTTELSYNERAGIAAASPALGFGNPAVGEAYVSNELKKIITDYNTKITAALTPASNGTSPIVSLLNTIPRFIAGGHIRGGGYFGVEGSIMQMIKTKYGSNFTYERLKTELKNTYGMGSDEVIPNLPNWDIARWCSVGSFSDKGLYPNDYVNYHNDWGASPYASYSNKDANSYISTGNQNAKIYFVKKTIRLDRTQLSWMKDYMVDVSLWNCIPICTAPPLPADVGAANPRTGTSNIWVDKKYDEFTIFVSWVYPSYNLTNIPVAPNGARASMTNAAAFYVINNEMANTEYNSASNISGESSAGLSIYPTVSFRLTGFPYAHPGLSVDLSDSSPIITAV